MFLSYIREVQADNTTQSNVKARLYLNVGDTTLIIKVFSDVRKDISMQEILLFLIVSTVNWNIANVNCWFAY